MDRRHKNDTVQTFNVIIIGAGPHGLAMAAALSQDNEQSFDPYLEDPYSTVSHIFSKTEEGNVTVKDSRAVAQRKFDRPMRNVVSYLKQCTIHISNFWIDIELLIFD